MSLKARVYVGFIISIGAIALGYGLYPWEGPNLLRFLCYLALAIPASCLKVTLPGTISVLFIFLLGGMSHENVDC